jgi:hypothetical protein
MALTLGSSGTASRSAQSGVTYLGASQTAVVYTTFTIAGSAIAFSSSSGNLYIYGLSQPAVTSFVVPSSEMWHLVDIYISSSLSIDAQFQLVVNGIVQPLVIELNSTIVTNSARVKLPTPFTILPNQTISTNFLIYTANGATTSVTENCFLVFVRQPL